MRTISYFTVFVMLSPVALMAQTALPAEPVPAQAAVHDPAGQTLLAHARGTAPVNLPFSNGEMGATSDDNVFSANQQRVGNEAPLFSPSLALLETNGCQKRSLNYSPSSLLCPPTNPFDKLTHGLNLGSSNRSGTAIMLDLPDSHNYLADGVQPVPEGQIVSGRRSPADLDSKDYASPATARANTTGLEALHSGNEKRDKAFLNAVPQSGKGRNAMRGKVAPIILALAVHAAVTWDAQSTNHFFHHYPEGYRPTEIDPLMRPFAGKALMYPMANLLFAVPFDLLLFKTRHSQKPIRILTYAAASYWVGLEIRQSLVNMGNEHVNGSN